MKIDDLLWHDGVVVDWRFTPNYQKGSSIEIVLRLYADLVRSPERRQVIVRCKATRRFLMSCDVAELKDNAGAGNIIDGHRLGDVLRLMLTGGFIEIEASSFTVDDGLRRPHSSKKRARSQSGSGRGAKGRRTRG